MANYTKALATPALLSWARKQSGLTYQQIFFKTGILKKKFISVEQGKTYFHLDQLDQLAKIFNVALAVFYLSEVPDFKVLTYQQDRKYIDQVRK
jgi:transcriptional regulator with XRE-family HTH domain